jgi:hypothetical protein
MSRGPGKWQLAILRAVRKPGLFPLRGATAAETAALVHAALKLEASGQCVVVRRRCDEGGRTLHFAAPLGTAVPGE